MLTGQTGMIENAEERVISSAFLLIGPVDLYLLRQPIFRCLDSVEFRHRAVGKLRHDLEGDGRHSWEPDNCASANERAIHHHRLLHDSKGFDTVLDTPKVDQDEYRTGRLSLDQLAPESNCTLKLRCAPYTR